jgi:hypothetical protein
VIDVAQLAEAAEVSVVATRKHWRHVAVRLHLAMHTRRRAAPMPRGGTRSIPRMVLVRRGRLVAPPTPSLIHKPGEKAACAPGEAAEASPVTRDHARDRSIATSVIHRRRRWQGHTRRRRVRSTRLIRKASRRPRAGPGDDQISHGPAP